MLHSKRAALGRVALTVLVLAVVVGVAPTVFAASAFTSKCRSGVCREKIHAPKPLTKEQIEADTREYYAASKKIYCSDMTEQQKRDYVVFRKWIDRYQRHTCFLLKKSYINSHQR